MAGDHDWGAGPDCRVRGVQRLLLEQRLADSLTKLRLLRLQGLQGLQGLQRLYVAISRIVLDLLDWHSILVISLSIALRWLLWWVLLVGRGRVDALRNRRNLLNFLRRVNRCTLGSFCIFVGLRVCLSRSTAFHGRSGVFVSHD